MLDPFVREKIENWVGDFCASDALGEFSGATREFATEMLAGFLTAACERGDISPEDIEEPDVKHGLLHAARLNLPASAKRELPALCGAFLTQLENEGRLGGGRLLGAFARALTVAADEAVSGKPKPITRAGSKIGRNDPCPCGSGKKYKKCCMKD